MCISAYRGLVSAQADPLYILEHGPQDLPQAFTLDVDIHRWP